MLLAGRLVRHGGGLLTGLGYSLVQDRSWFRLAVSFVEDSCELGVAFSL